MANARKPLLVTDWKALPNGYYLQRAAGVGLGGHAVGVLSERKVPVGGITWVTGPLIQNNTVILPDQNPPKSDDEKHKITPQLVREQAAGALATTATGGTLLLTAELCDRLGTSATAKHLAQEVIKVPAASGEVEAGLNWLRTSWPSFWNVVKLAIFAVTLFFVVVRGVELLYGEDVPPAATGIAVAMWLGAVLAFGTWLFDVYPFAVA